MPIQPAQNLSFFRGEDVFIDATVEPDDPLTGSIAGWSIVFSLSAARGGTVLITKTIGSGVTIMDAVLRLVTITIPRSETDSLPDGTYYYDVQRTDLNEHAVLAWGQARVRQDVGAL